jgi:hypothetical protein
MKTSKYTVEHLLYLFTFILALCLRFYSLGSLPLGEHEAALAMQAFHISRGVSTEIASSNLLVVWTGGLFFLFGSSEALARLIPALMGGLLVISPFYFKKWLGNVSAVILAFALALEPGLVAISRQVDGTILAITFTVFAFICLINHRYLWTGLLIGLALMSGPALWPGWLAIVLAIGWDYLPGFHRQSKPDWLKIFSQERAAAVKMGLMILGTILLGGSLFFLVPAGTGAFAGSISEYLRGYTNSIGTPILLMVTSLGIYQLLAIFLAPAEIWRGWREHDPITSFLFRWFLFALLLALIYPNRSISDLAWCLLPLWGMAARSAAKMFQYADLQEHFPALGQAILTIILLVFAWFDLTALTNPVQDTTEMQLRLATFGGAVILLVCSMLLITWGWSGHEMLKGFSQGLAAFLLIIMISNSIHSTGLSGKPAEEMWLMNGSLQSEDLLVKTVNDISEWRIGRTGGLEVVVVNFPSKALDWALRKLDSVQFVQTLPPQTNPAMVITHGRQEISLTSAYRGQSLGWTENTTWMLLDPKGWLKWLAYREAPTETDSLILWVRSDLFPGGSVVNGSTQP